MSQKLCSHCLTPIRTKASMHTWCAKRVEERKAQIVARRESSAVPLPIEPLEDLPMAKAVERISPSLSLEQIQLVASEYEAMKEESERIAKELTKKSNFLKEALQSLPGMRIGLDGRDLGLVACVSETFDLERAKKVKDLKKKLIPYIQTIEKLDLDAARNHLGENPLKRFITIKESFQLRFLKRDEHEQ